MNAPFLGASSPFKGVGALGPITTQPLKCVRRTEKQDYVCVESLRTNQTSVFWRQKEDEPVKVRTFGGKKISVRSAHAGSPRIYLGHNCDLLTCG